ncbi:MAG: Rv1355c family protein [Thermaurantimonas sp.]|uniref:Rv1355c family protein n=1 Tax=Thermaurantimonas sp. TaxID=2681568 RepID=UPI003918A29E
MNSNFTPIENFIEHWRAEFFTNEEFQIAQKHLTNLIIYDIRESIYHELFKILHPEITSKHSLYNQKSKDFIREKLEEKSDIWVYYPWKNTACRIPSEEDFVRVRTARNQYKITPQEQKILSSKKVGIIGLSVGQTIAITMAMERSATEFRLADFDELELSNINRLRSGITNIGLKKVVIAAREIAEIDPFLKVKIYPEGITRENLDDFLLTDGKIDLLVDECDGLDIKIVARHRARELGIPVLMDTSDRGMLDVERFDLEPLRPILHGLADGLNPDNISELTNEEKIPYILDMVSAEQMSARLKASMLEVQQTINTWPQLASSVFLGGAMGADTARRIFLNQYTQSGRYYLDFEELIPDKAADEIQPSIPTPPDEPDWNQYFDHFVKKLPRKNHYLKLSTEEIESLIRAAALAPSGGNVQPWKWLLFEDTFYLFLNPRRAFSFLDVDFLGSYLALGAALENFETAAKALHLKTQLQYSLDNEFTNLIASIQVIERSENSDSTATARVRFLYERHTNRLKGSIEKIDAAFFEEAEKQLETGQKIKLLTHRADIEEFAKLVGIADRIRLTHPWAHHDFMNETRWNDAHARETCDGIDIETLNPTVTDKAAFRVLRDWNALSLTADWGLGKGLEKMSRETVEKSGALMMVQSDGCDRNQMLMLGKTVEKIWILAAQYEIGFQPVSPITFLMYRNRLYPNTYHRPWQNALLAEAENAFKKLFQIDSDYSFGFVFRLFKSTDVVKKSYRLPIHQIFTHYTV